MLTGAGPEGFNLQLDALRRLVDAHVICHPSVMASFSTTQNLETLKLRLQEISSSLARDMEVEELILYPHVERRLRNTALTYYRAHSPNRVPPEQV
jgi:uncharacterized Fe-S cluster-containing radical SAM superfamily protein